MLNALVRPPNFLLFLTWLQGSENQVKRKKRGVEKINCLTRPVLPFFEKIMRREGVMEYHQILTKGIQVQILSRCVLSSRMSPQCLQVYCNKCIFSGVSQQTEQNPSNACSLTIYKTFIRAERLLEVFFFFFVLSSKTMNFFGKPGLCAVRNEIHLNPLNLTGFCSQKLNVHFSQANPIRDETRPLHFHSARQNNYES